MFNCLNQLGESSNYFAHFTSKYDETDLLLNNGDELLKARSAILREGKVGVSINNWFASAKPHILLWILNSENICG